MGHYDEQYAESDRQREVARQERIGQRTKKIQAAIDAVGIARVLAELMEDSRSYG